MTHNDEHVKSNSKTYEVQTNICIKCKQKLENSQDSIGKTTANMNAIESKEIKEILPFNERKKITNYKRNSAANYGNFLPFCKSENDIMDTDPVSEPIKERSRLTTTTFSRCNTFVGSTSDCLKTIDFDSRLKKRNISIPNHIPVRTYVNNIECIRNKTV